MKSVLSIVGARPQFIKLFPIHNALVSRGINHLVVHTGQHYDSEMSELFFTEFSLPEPDFNLGIGGGSSLNQLSQMLIRIESTLLALNPSMVLVYGDTNSTLAACLSAVKLDIPVAHIESGLRSYDRLMPEEQNRIVVDHLSNYLFAPTQNAMNNLRDEGLLERSLYVGDVMFDVALEIQKKLNLKKSLSKIMTIVQGRPYFLATVHRASNTNSRERIVNILNALNTLGNQVILPLHPRLRDASKFFQIELNFENIIFLPPQSYAQISELIYFSQGVITDSGGLQKEAFFAQKKCFTLRNTTEWPETLEGGWNTLINNIADLNNEVSSVTSLEQQDFPFGEGNAASQIVDFIQLKIGPNI